MKNEFLPCAWKSLRACPCGFWVSVGISKLKIFAGILRSLFRGSRASHCAQNHTAQHDQSP